MLLRTDPFRALDRLATQAFESGGTWSRPAAMPMDAWRHGDEFVVEFDLPGIDPDAVELSVERSTLTVKAERRPTHTGTTDQVEWVASERAYGVFARQLLLGDNLDTSAIHASYDAGVLRIRIPVAEAAKPRTITVESGHDSDRPAINA
ncbi:MULTISPECIES: Hsp20/alpha crystallin family protein [Pseudonocardia]|jgi:HSP20 family protein|uniref:Hsp20/alpha crystallin family protein n=1 Tax=Pseudonocardia TaxID=1847 RepID=UPI0006CB3DA1|nr:MULTISPECIES: Hsp20/alpha crystallin family protein [Pseudonocardia]ALE81232.1 heat-shock protein Hsp20 [Pseudonocardia sp. AL041005-10]NWJ72764.1 Hsp20/alpha crystallin family protein [Pseudonocardia pini]